jgi:hypothetical protein
MKKLALLALAVATLLGAGLLVWELRSSSSPAAASGPAPGGPGSTEAGADRRGAPIRATAGEPGSGSGAGLAGDPGREVPAPLTAEEKASIDMERVLAGEVPQRVKAAAAGCFDGSGMGYKDLENTDDAIDLDFQVVLKNGTASIQNVKLARGIGDADLEHCVVEAVGEVQWQDPVNPDFSIEMGDTISMLALKKWGEPMPHELEEIPETPEEADFGPKVRN